MTYTYVIGQLGSVLFELVRLTLVQLSLILNQFTHKTVCTPPGPGPLHKHSCLTSIRLMMYH